MRLPLLSIPGFRVVSTGLFSLVSLFLGVAWPHCVAGAPSTGAGAIPPANNPANPVNPVSPSNPVAVSRNVDTADPGSNPASAPPDDAVPTESRGENAPPATRRVGDRPLTVSEFVGRVLRANLDLAAQRFNVSIARAQLVAARVSPNPVLNLGTGRDLTHEDQPTTYFAGVTAQVELPGKRANRTTAAVQSLLAASATLDDYLRTLRGTAASAYVDAVSGQLILAEKQRAFHSLDQLASANDIRYKAGDLSEVDDDQAHADALQARGDLYSSESSDRANQYALLGLLGEPVPPCHRPSTASIYAPVPSTCHGCLPGRSVGGPISRRLAPRAIRPAPAPGSRGSTGFRTPR